MSIGPILPGRLPSSLVATRLQRNIQRASQLLQQLQDQAATGQRFLIPSEEPTSAIRTMVLQATIERKDQFRSNLQTDQSMLAAAESSIASVSDALTHAKSLLLAGVGDTASTAEKQAMADEVNSLIQSVVSAGNARHLGRFLFGGSESKTLPFTDTGNYVRYNGDRLNINSVVDFDLSVANNVDGVAAFDPLTKSAGGNANPAVTLATKLSDLNGGAGIASGTFAVTVDNGGPVTQTIDLSGAETLGDVKARIENAFAPGTVTVSVIAPPNSNGLQIAPTAGTVAVADVNGQHVARELGIASAAAASITGTDIDPRLTLQTQLSAFNNGAGATTASGLQITNGELTRTIDISSATTVEELFNILESENLDLEMRINDAGDGLSIAGRRSGAPFAIGENGGNDAASLGIRTFTATSTLAELNFGTGVPVNEFDTNGLPLPAEIEIVRRDGTTTTVDLQGQKTIQDVLNTITAVDANLTATLNTSGNGISITDTSGTGPLEVRPSAVADALGLTGKETGTNNAVPLTGSDVNQSKSTGVISLLIQLENALRSGDDRTLHRLDNEFNAEIARFNLVRGEIGSRLNLLEDVENRLLDEDLELHEQLSRSFDADLAEVVSQIANVSAVLEATYRIAASTANLTLLSFL